jgi:hypothetical protein
MYTTGPRATSRPTRIAQGGRAVLLGIVMCATPAIVSSQQFRGTLAGIVTDQTGAVLPGARVALTELATNATLVTVTNPDGFYILEYLPPGRYRLRLEAKGFQLAIFEDVEIRVGDRLTLDARLTIGQIDSSVMVSADATPLLQRGSSIGSVIDRRRIEELPLADGNPFTLARLAPGIAFTDVNNLRFTRPFDNGGTSSISANGAGSQAGEFTLDGVPNNAAFGRQVAYVPPAEAVQEFKIVTSSFDAQQGHSAGPYVDVVSRSGANRASGSIHWFNRNEALAANEFFVNANPNCERDSDGDCRKNPLRYNRYGATLGGPVMLPVPGGMWSGKDRLFFFLAYEGLRQTTPSTSRFTVPTEVMRN